MTRPRDIVLVVDDSPATLGLLNEALENAGYTVLVAQSGTTALTLVDRVTPDIVLMDALMPGPGWVRNLPPDEAKSRRLFRCQSFS